MVRSYKDFADYVENQMKYVVEIKIMEAAVGFEPTITVLQTVALATWLCRLTWR